jgi:hypothetical protein
MAFYVKKEVEPREARQLTETNRDEIMEWCGGKKGLDGSILLKTLESEGGRQVAQTSDFIMKGYSEEEGWHFWPVKSGYMSENYKKVSD